MKAEDLGFARIDHHRHDRLGTNEVIFGEGKEPSELLTIAGRIFARDERVLCTRVSRTAATLFAEEFPDAVYHARSGSIALVRRPAPRLGSVAVVSAGTSDGAVAEEALVCAEFFGARVRAFADVGVAGIHRLLSELDEIALADVVIAVAGMEGALPSVLGGLIGNPIIAVPTSIGYGAALGGLTPLMAMLTSCAQGLSVVNIDNGFGAAAAAFRILRLKYANAPADAAG